MKHLFICLGISLMLLALGACDDEEVRIVAPEQEVAPPPLMEVTDSTLCFVRDFAGYFDEDLLLDRAGQVGPIVRGIYGMLINSRVPQMEALFAAESDSLGMPGALWQMGSYVIRYRTVSARGEDIVLSARITFPQYMDSRLTHRVGTLSLVHHSYAMGWVPSDKLPKLLCPRVMQNTVLIEPDYEGHGASEGEAINFLSNKVMARQMADCALAALELMRRHGVELAPDGYSTNWGISFGAGPALAFAHYYETEAPEPLRQALRLHSTFAADGPLSLEGALDVMNDRPDFNATLMHVMLAGLGALSPEQLEGYQLQDFLPDWMLTRQVTLNGQEYLYYDLWLHDKVFFSSMANGEWEERSSITFAELFAADMYGADGRLNEDSPKVRLLRRLLAEACDYGGWIPLRSIYMAHYPDDGMIPYGQAFDCYQRMALRGGAVHWFDETLPSIVPVGNPMMTHCFVSIQNILRACVCALPEEVSRTLQQVDGAGVGL